MKYVEFSNFWASCDAPKVVGQTQGYKPIWVLATENNAQDKVLIERNSDDDTIFTGC